MHTNQNIIMDEKYFVYVIKSLSRNYIYVGLTNNVSRRFAEHQAGQEKTAPYCPFKLVHTEEFPSRVKARAREKYLKSGVGKEWIKKNIIKK